MTRERTINDVRFDAAYGYFYGQLCQHAYRRLDLLLNVVQLIGGSAAALAAFGGSAEAIKWSGVALALFAALSLLVGPGVQAERHRACAEQFWLLRNAAGQLPLDQSERELAQLQAGADPGPGGLFSSSAYNEALDALGYDSGHFEISWPGRLMMRVLT